MKKSKPGPTGRFPKGKIRDDDDGELAIAITVADNKLIIDFGKEVRWIGLDKETGYNLMRMMMIRLQAME